MRHRNYGYHCSEHVIEPRKTTANIKGVELEISDYDCGEILDDMIERNLLTVPSNESEKKEYTIAIENDSSVYKELIIKACCNDTLFKHFRMLEKELHNEIDNGSGTSCHIHINNDFLQEKNIKQEDIVKATEFLAPLLYTISERSSSAYYDWCHSRIDFNTSEPTLFERVEKVDDIRIDNYCDRYNIVNPKRKTTEIRIFSNRCGFEYRTLKLYIEMIDFIIEIAEEMKDKLYEEEFDNLIEKIEAFFNKRNRKEFISKYQLEPFFLKEGEYHRARLMSRIGRVKEKFENIREQYNEVHDNFNLYIRLLRIFRDNRRFLRNIESIEINTMNTDYINEIENEVISNIEQEILNL